MGYLTLIVRLIFVAFVLWRVYGETGPFTTVFLFFLWLGMECVLFCIGYLNKAITELNEKGELGADLDLSDLEKIDED